MLRRLSGGLSGPLTTSRGSGAGDEELSCSTMAETVHGTAALPHPAENDQTIRGGWLYKQSTKRKVLSGKPVYNRRYFILQGAEPGDASLQCARLVWYETNQSSKARDSVELTRECSARSLSGMDKPLHRKFHLELTVPGKRVFVLRASSADSRDEWIVALERAISATRVDESTGMSKPNSPAVRMGEVEDEEGDVEVDQRPVILLQPAPGEGGGKQPPAAAEGVSTAVQAGEDTAAVGDSKPRAEDGVGAVEEEGGTKGAAAVEEDAEIDVSAGPHPLEDKDTIRSGWLSKQTANKTGYRRRYFILQGSATGPPRLTWYDSNKASYCKDFVALPADGSVVARSLAVLDRPPQGRFFFELDVQASKQRTYLLRAETGEDRDGWVTALSRAIAPVVTVDEGTTMTPPVSPFLQKRRQQMLSALSPEARAAINSADSPNGLAVASSTHHKRSAFSSPVGTPTSPGDADSPSLGRFQAPRQHPSPLRYRKSNNLGLASPQDGGGHTLPPPQGPQEASPPRRASQAARLPPPTYPGQSEPDPSPDKRRLTFSTTALGDSIGGGQHSPNAALSPTPYRHPPGQPSVLTPPSNRSFADFKGASPQQQQAEDDGRWLKGAAAMAAGPSLRNTTQVQWPDMSPSRSFDATTSGGADVSSAGLSKQLEILMAMNLRLKEEQQEERRSHAESVKRLSEQMDEERRRHAEETRILALHIQDLGEGPAAQLRLQLEAEKSRAGKLEDRVKELQVQLDRAREEANRFVREAEDVQALGSRREKEATEAKEAAERQARAVMEEVSMLRGLNQELQERLQEGEEEGRRVRDKAADREQEMAGVKKQLREVERRLAEALADGEAMRREVEARVAETGEDGKLMESACVCGWQVWNMNHALREEKAALQAEARERERSCKILTRELEAMIEQHQGITEQADQLAAEVSRLKSERDEALETLSKTTDEAEMLRMWQTAQMEEMARTTGVTATLEQTSALLSADNRKLKEDLDLLKADTHRELSSTRSRVRELEQQLAQAREEAEAGMETSRGLAVVPAGGGSEEGEVEALRTRVKQLEDKAADAHQMVQELERGRSAMEARALEAEDAAMDLEAELIARKEQTQSLRDRLDGLEEEVSLALAEKEDAERRLAAALQKPLEQGGQQQQERSMEGSAEVEEALQGRVKELEAEVQRAKDELARGEERWEDEVGRLQAQVSQLTVQVERADEELDTSQNRAEHRFKDLQEQVAELQAELLQADEELEQSDKRTEDLERAASEAREELDKRDQELVELRTKLECAREAEQKLDEMRDTLESVREEAEQQIGEMRVKLESAREEAEQQLTEMRAQLQQRAREGGERQQQPSSTEASAEVEEVLQSRVKELEAEVQRAKDELARGEERWDAEVGRLQAQVRQMEAQVRRANDELDTSQNRSEHRFRDLQAQVTELQAQLLRTEEELDLSDKRSEALKRAASEVREELDKRDRELGEMRVKLKSARKEAEQAERDRHKERMEAIREMETAAAAWAGEKAAMEHAAAELEGKLTAAVEEMERAEALLQKDVEQQVAGGNGEKRLMRAVTELQEAMASAQARAEVLEAEVRSMKEQAKAVEASKHAVEEELDRARRQLLQLSHEREKSEREWMEELDRTRSGVDEAGEVLSGVQRERDEALRALETAKEQLRQAREQAEAAEKEVQGGLEKMAVMGRELERERESGAEAEKRMSTAVKEAEARLAEAEAALAEARLEVEELQYTVQGLEEAKAEVEGRLRSEEARSAAMEMFNQEAGGTVRELEAELARRAGEEAALRTRLEEAESAAAAKRAEGEAAKAEMKAAIEGAEAQVVELKARADQLASELRGKEEEEKAMRGHVEELIAALKQAKGDRKVARKEAAEARARAEEQVVALQASIRDLEEQLQLEAQRREEIEGELAAARTALQAWERRLTDEVGRLVDELEEEKRRADSLQEAAGEEARRAAEAEQARDAVLRDRRQHDAQVAAQEQERVAEARLLLEAERQKVEAQKLALAREKRAIEGQMMTLSKEVIDSLHEVQRRKEAVMQHGTQERPQQENFRPQSAPTVPEHHAEPAYAPVRAMSERNAIREELRRQADESRQLKGNIQTLKADLKVAYSQVGELARARSKAAAVASQQQQQRPSGSDRARRDSRDKSLIYSKDEMMRMQRELQHRRDWLNREDAARKGGGASASQGGAWV